MYELEIDGLNKKIEDIKLLKGYSKAEYDKIIDVLNNVKTKNIEMQQKIYVLKTKFS